jgi:hypothetical protein
MENAIPPNYRVVDCCPKCSYGQEQDVFSGMSQTLIFCTKYSFRVQVINVCDDYKRRE